MTCKLGSLEEILDSRTIECESENVLCWEKRDSVTLLWESVTCEVGESSAKQKMSTPCNFIFGNVHAKLRQKKTTKMGSFLTKRVFRIEFVG